MCSWPGTATPKALPAYHAYKIGNFSIGNHWFTRVWDAYTRYMRISNILLALGAYEARIYTRVYIRAYIYARTRSSKNWTFYASNAHTRRNSQSALSLTRSHRETEQKQKEAMEDALIVAVCGQSVLYDTTLVSYRDRIKKEQAWVVVGQETGIPGKLSE